MAVGQFRAARTAVMIIYGSLVSSCDGSAPSPAVTDAGTRPNYYEDVYPIFSEHCLACHAAGGVPSGVSLDSYEGALQSVYHLKHVLANHEMPPWGTDASGACGEWQNPRWVPSDEIATVLAWIDNGTPAGDRAKRRLPTAIAPASVPVAGVDVRVGAGYEPTPGEAAVRCFVVDPQIATDQFVTGLSYTSETHLGVEQLAVYALDSAEAETAAAALDAADEEPGYPCGGNSRIPDARFVIGMSWATDVMRLPTGTGVRVAAGRKLVVQAHYNLYAAGPKTPTLSLELAPVARAGRWLDVHADAITLAPKQDDTTAVVQSVLEQGATVLALYPEMRLYGRSLRLTADSPGGSGRACVMNQNVWEFHMDREPRLYVEPQIFPAGALLTLTCHYNTVGRTEPIHDGPSLADEECGVLLYTTM